MEELQKLLDKRAKLLKDMRALLDSAGDKGLSGELEQKYSRMEADFEALDKQIKAMQKMSELEAQLKEPTSDPIVTEPSARGANKMDIAKNAFMSYLRGEDPNQWRNALTTQTGEGGGYVVPEEFQKEVVKRLFEVSRTRAISKVIRTSHTRNIPVQGGIPQFSIIPEGGQYPEANTSFGKKVLGAYKLGGLIALYYEWISDAVIDGGAEQYVIDQLSIGLAEAEGKLFANGSGTDEPQGYRVGLAPTVTLASKTGIGGDEIIDIYYSLKPQYRARATWRLEDSWMKAIRKLKDNNGNYIFAPALVNGERDKLLGRPIEVDPYLPVVGTGSENAIVLGDFSYYVIGDRSDIVVSKSTDHKFDYDAVALKVSKRFDAVRVVDEAFVAAATPA